MSDTVLTARQNFFSLNGKSSLDWGMVVSCEDGFDTPERDITTDVIPGRNGVLITDNGRFENIEIKYTCVIEENFKNAFRDFKAYVGKLIGYIRLEDSFNPDRYRMVYIRQTKIKQLSSRYRGGEFEVTFNCMPQLFLKSGEEPLQFMLVMIDQDEIEEGGETYIRESYQTGRYKLGTSKTYTITVHTQNGATANLIVVGSYDDNPSPFSYFRTMDNVVDGGTMTDTITDGVTDSLEFAFFADDNHALDDIWLEISMTILVNNVEMPINAIMAKKWTITNPTGFASKPLFEYFFVTDTAIKITNIVDGVEEEYFNVSSANSVALPCVYMDCDMQYMYDKDGDNLSQTLTITTAQDAKGRNLVFPQFGTDEILIEMGAGSHDTLGILNIYPRWWEI